MGETHAKENRKFNINEYFQTFTKLFINRKIKVIVHWIFGQFLVNRCFTNLQKLVIVGNIIKIMNIPKFSTGKN